MEGKKYHIPRDPEFLRNMPLIPNWLTYLLPGELGQVTKKQRKQIHRLLGLRKGELLPRCRGKKKAFVLACEKRGDYSHSDKNHYCLECRCKRVAGSGTKGDFYGFGIQTGHLGVGYCMWCQQVRRMLPSEALMVARHEVSLMQQYGEVRDNMEYSLTVAKREAEAVQNEERVRAELKLVVDELERFQALLQSSKKPTEWVKGELVPWSDKTIFDAKMEIAKTISRLKLDDLKLDKDNFVHVNELIKRMPEMINIVSRCLSKLEELIVAKQIRGEEIETDQNPREYVMSLVQTEIANLWRPVGKR